MSDPRMLERLSALHREDVASGMVPRPRSRWLMRYVLPIAVVLLALALLAYAARDALMPALEVSAVPVVTRAAAPADEADPDARSERQSASPLRESAIVAQAPGWIEPDPYAITVQPLVSGVVDEVLVLEGDRVSQGDVLVRLMAADAELRVRRSRAELAELHASRTRAAATLAAAEARLDEIQDEVDRKRALVEVGGVSQGEFARLEHRLRSQRAEVGAARATHQEAEAAIQRQQVVLEEAELALERTVIRAPVDGVVLSRSVVPGTRIMAAGDGPGEAHFPGVMRLYDPANLQVRADVPLTDAAKVRVGTRARMTSEVLPDHVFEGAVTRIVHLADIQRNTVQVKVRIHDPSPLLKPEMLCRVRFFDSDSAPSAGRAGDSPRAAATDDGSLRVYAIHDALLNHKGDRAQVWVVEPGAGGRGRIARLRDIAVGERDGNLVLVRSGLRPGDRLILNPPASLQPEMRVRVSLPFSEATKSEGP
ncbi:MAG TPA: efflux RND transporter periplasmic adaptor subunit [Phycisphaerales bacterium]|nr:efflux RND transporter periplasmic adaptor subunit [Phycisphaerales bacterium]HRQ76715.1 efflux RND transporter periplasmic adaptor subunit [Phycisphaerales bacterium]